MRLTFSRRQTLAVGAATALLPGNAFAAKEAPLSRIAFGSCCHQDKEQPIWDPVLGFDPQLFVFLGDNIYADTEDMAIMQAKYDKFAAKPGFQKLRAHCPTIAIWDDHDYGKNDAGREYPKKAESKQLFLKFWQEPQASPRWSREGIYTSYIYGPPGKRVQVILPDLRWFRSGLLGNTEEPHDRGPYLPNFDPKATMLGPQQWEWLERELRKPAEVRILGMSTQVLADAPGYEAWANMPFERRRLFDLIDYTEARGVVFISGDTHYSELSKLTDGVPYPFYDLTSSGLTQEWPFLAPNDNRVGPGFTEANFGAITIDWKVTDPIITMETRNKTGKLLIQQRIALSTLR
ncbi:alkaline phosphatase D family protein [Aquisediminimonas sediminicola]|uniref:alkaline phosphatase D family protein n=1 Tax=Alteraquisediminimonas sediminicola TaxID=2676787 RepID=UPI001C8E1C4E|nr:alkaline phosphatase D family protein [Aquisediminimonas sediminicola]